MGACNSTEAGIKSMGKKPRIVEVDGFRLPPTAVPEVFRSAVAFKPKDGDVVVATYPKCGTTWVMQIVLTILRKGQTCSSAQEYFARNPFLDMMGAEGVKFAMEPYCIKTHLPFDRINFNPGAKYIYVARHPADCVISFFHHVRFFPIYFFTDGEFEDFFELFINDGVDFNDYFDHLFSWYNNRDKPNILFITYESLKADTKGSILKMARFLGEEYYECLVANKGKILNDVLHFSTLDFMRATINGFWREMFVDQLPPEELLDVNPVFKQHFKVWKEATESGHKPQGEFIRKGNVGEGKIVLSDEHREKMNAYIKRKTAHCPEIMSIWQNQ